MPKKNAVPGEIAQLEWDMKRAKTADSTILQRNQLVKFRNTFVHLCSAKWMLHINDRSATYKIEILDLNNTIHGGN